MGFCDPARANPLQFGLLLVELLPEPFVILASVSVDPILYFW